MQRQKIQVACYDLPTVSRFFRSVALSVASSQYTTSEWVQTQGSPVIDAIYSVLFWKTPPGTVEVRQPVAVIESTTNVLHEKYLSTWVRKMHTGGPMAAYDYVDQMAKVRQGSADSLSQLFRDAHQINQGISGETAHAIRTLARIKLVGDVGVYGLGAYISIATGGTGAVLLTGVDLGYSVTCKAAKTWEANDAIKAVAIEGGEAALELGATKFAETQQIKGLMDHAQAKNNLRSAQGQIRKYSARLREEGLRKAQHRKARNIVSRSQQLVAKNQSLMEKAGRATKVAGRATKAIPVLFAAKEIWGAWTEYDATIGALDQ